MRTNGATLRTSLTIGLMAAASGCNLPEELAHLDAVLPPPENAVSCITSPHDVSETIGSQGGTIAVETPTSEGVRRHSLTVRPGAVPQGEQVTFRLVEPPNGYVMVRVTHNAKADAVRSMTLRLSYAGCGVQPADTAGLQLYRWHPGRVRWEPVPGSTHHWEGQVVEAVRDSLSAYALGAS